MPRKTPQTPETKEKIRLANMGHIVTVETRQKISNSKKGKKLKEETKQKMSQVRIGKKLPPFTQSHKDNISKSKMGSVPWNKGKVGVQQSTRKGKRNIVLMGNKNPAWKGGITAIQLSIRKMPEYKEWRKKVFERDNYVCKSCGYSEGHIIEADHIVPLSWIVFNNKITNIQEASQCQELWDIENGETLCSRCHKLTPTWGKKFKTWLKENNLC